MSQCVLPLDPSFGKFEHIILWVLARMKQNNPNLNDDVFDSMFHDMTMDLQKTNIRSTPITIVCTKDAPSNKLTMTQVVGKILESGQIM
jgi:hypothetical protein